MKHLERPRKLKPTAENRLHHFSAVGEKLWLPVNVRVCLV